MIKLKDLIKEQNLNESELTEIANEIIQMAKSEVEDRFKELQKFFDNEKIKKDNPTISTQKIENDLKKSIQNITVENFQDNKINEDFKNFVLSIKNNVKSFFTNKNIFLKGILLIPSLISLIQYIKDPKGLMDYFLHNMTSDGIKYKNMKKNKTQTFKSSIAKKIFPNDPGLLDEWIHIGLNILFWAVLVAVYVLYIKDLPGNLLFKDKPDGIDWPNR